jgi:hypothetical protein
MPDFTKAAASSLQIVRAGAFAILVSMLVTFPRFSNQPLTQDHPQELFGREFQELYTGK